jgi:glycosyltransferase involved in cell wall biosynthesis
VRLGVVSPFLDRQHGTELCIVEQIERLASREHWQIELYSQRVAQIDGLCAGPAAPGSGEGRIFWHRVSQIPGPQLLKYPWWFFANHWARWKDRRLGRVRYDLLYSPGINCLDADVIVVHIVFHAFYESVHQQLALLRVPVRSWPRVLHRKLYYKLIMFLERRIYRKSRVGLLAVSTVVAKQLDRYFGRQDVVVIPNATDPLRFNPAARGERRPESRSIFGLRDDDFVVLLIGNDWKKKGLDALLEAAAQLRDLPLRLQIVGTDDPGIYRAAVEKLGLGESTRFEAPSGDVMRFYAAADVYAGPSLEDAFNLPILEAMACGLPVVASAAAGAAELIEHGITGFVLPDPRNAEMLAQLLRSLWADAPWRARISEAAASAARGWTWEENAARLSRFIQRMDLA